MADRESLSPLASRLSPGVVTYRVATIQPDARGIWVLHAQEYATWDEAQQEGHARVLAPGVDRPRNAGIVKVLDGVTQVPTWMTVRDDGEEEQEQ